MQGKTKSFLEDTVILIIVVVLAFGSYKLYEYFSLDNQSEIQKEEIKTEEKTVLEIQEEPENVDIITNQSDEKTIEDSQTLESNKTSSTTNETKNVEKKTLNEKPIKKIEKVQPIQKVEAQKVKEVQKTSKIEPIQNAQPKIKETVKKIEIKEQIKDEVSKTKLDIKPIEKLVQRSSDEEIKKDVDLELLRKFLRDLKFNIASHIIKRDDLENSTSQKLKIRVTILPDGNYEKLTFISGDEVLFEQNKENIIKLFPVKVDDKIKADFPRYVRLTIK